MTVRVRAPASKFLCDFLTSIRLHFLRIPINYTLGIRHLCIGQMISLIRPGAVHDNHQSESLISKCILPCKSPNLSNKLKKKINQNTPFNTNFNKNGTTIYLSNQDISISIRKIGIIRRRNLLLKISFTTIKFTYFPTIVNLNV